MTDRDRNQAVLLGLLYAGGKSMLRTKLVKMTYLLDNLRFEQTGETMTTFTYQWDHYGPNAVGNAIVDTLANLGDQVKFAATPTYYGDTAHYYQCEGINPDDLLLSDDDWTYIRGIVHRYSPMTREMVVSESKKTLPMQDIKPYDELVFQANPSVTSIRDAILADHDFVQDTVDSIINNKGIPLETLRAALV